MADDDEFPVGSSRARNLSPLFSWRGAIVTSDLAGPTRFVALVLSLHMNEAGGSCFPSQETLGKECALSPRQVRHHLSVLRDEGWLNIHYRNSPGGRKAFYDAEVPFSVYLSGRSMKEGPVPDQ